MKRARDVIGLPIVAINTGKQLGTVRDLIVDERRELTGIVTDTKIWYASSRYIPVDGIVAFGADAVTVQSEEAVEPYEEPMDGMTLVSGKKKMKDLPLITVNGHQLGRIEDVYFEENLGKKIIGYELSDGFISDVMEGRKWLPAPESATIGEDAMIVPVHCEQELREIITPTDE